MKVIQITDEDAKELVKTLELEKHRSKEASSDQERQRWNEMHRAFHYHVVSWLHKHGANVT